MLRRGLTDTVDEECFRQFVLAVREIMHESGGAHPWLLQDCGRLLSDYIMHNNGLKYVLQGYLDGGLCCEFRPFSALKVKQISNLCSRNVC